MRIKLDLKPTGPPTPDQTPQRKEKRNTNTLNLTKISTHFWLIQMIGFWSEYVKLQKLPIIYSKIISKTKSIYLIHFFHVCCRIKKQNLIYGLLNGLDHNTLDHRNPPINFTLPLIERKLSRILGTMEKTICHSN